MSSVDWQSLTLVGERHCFELRVPGPGSAETVDRLCSGLEDAEFNVSGQIVADIAVAGREGPASDGSISLRIEALTIEE